MKAGIHIRDKLFLVLDRDYKCSPKSNFECGSDVANLMGTVCEFKVEFLRLKVQFCPLDTQKCNSYLSSRTSFKELVWLTPKFQCTLHKLDYHFKY